MLRGYLDRAMTAASRRMVERQARPAMAKAPRDDVNSPRAGERRPEPRKHQE